MTATERALRKISAPPTQDDWHRHLAQHIAADHPEWSDEGRSRFAAGMTLAAIVVGCIVVWALAVYGGGHLAGWW
jgi:hypothetical protein